MQNLQQMTYPISKNHSKLHQTIVFIATILQNQKSKTRDTNQTQNHFWKKHIYLLSLLILIY
jgi:hypothetical protein